ncbi:MAG: plastocyanin/azurin family copper-binding protein [Ilumatobacteraceae bacterium]
MTQRILPLLAAGLLTLTACGGGDDGSSADPTTVDTTATSDAPATPDATGDAAASPTVTISDSRFDQTELRVQPGTTVVFTNTDPYAHTVTSADGSAFEFDSDRFGEGETFEVSFDDAGEYSYFCQIHPTMRAKVIVG